MPTAPGRSCTRHDGYWTPRLNPHIDYLASCKSIRIRIGPLLLIFGDWGGSGASTAGRLYSYGSACLKRTGLGRPWDQAPPQLASALGSSILHRIRTSAVTFSFDREVWRTQNTAIDESLAFSPMAWRPAGLEPRNFITERLMTASRRSMQPVELFAALNGGLGGFI